MPIPAPNEHDVVGDRAEHDMKKTAKTRRPTAVALMRPTTQQVEGGGGGVLPCFAARQSIIFVLTCLTEHVISVSWTDIPRPFASLRVQPASQPANPFSCSVPTARHRRHGVSVFVASRLLRGLRIRPLGLITARSRQHKTPRRHTHSVAIKRTGRHQTWTCPARRSGLDHQHVSKCAASLSSWSLDCRSLLARMHIAQKVRVQGRLLSP